MALSPIIIEYRKSKRKYTHIKMGKEKELRRGPK
jgi:hypothetical protein